MFEVINASHRALRIKNSLRRFVRFKSSDDNYRKQVHKDNKLMFGTLLETSKERMARMKREQKARKKNIQVSNNAQNVDSEFSWVMGMSKNIRKIQFSATTTHRKILIENGCIVEGEKLDNFKSTDNSETTDNADENLGPHVHKTISSLSDELMGVPIYEKRVFKKNAVLCDTDVVDLEKNKYQVSDLMTELPKNTDGMLGKDERVMNSEKHKSLRNLVTRVNQPVLQNVDKEKEQRIDEGDTTPKNMEMDVSLNKGGDKALDMEKVGKQKNLLPRIAINHLTTFPICDSSKKIVVRTQNNSWIDMLKNKISFLSNVETPKVEERNPEILSISQYGDKENLVFPSVTRILSATMSEESKLNLELWKQRMILELGREGFAKYSAGLLRDGKLFHSMVQNKLTNKPFELLPEGSLALESIQDILKEISYVEAVETHAVHSKLHYRGIVDCVAWYRGKLCVIDWKKSDKPKTTIDQTYDAPLQVASYIGAINTDKNYPFEVKNGLVVVAYTNGDPGSVHELDENTLQKYWRFWLRRLQKYHIGQLESR